MGEFGWPSGFWEANDSTDYLDWSKANKVTLPNLKPTTKTISLRLPQHLLDSIKAAANSLDVPYESLIKILRNLRDLGAPKWRTCRASRQKRAAPLAATTCARLKNLQRATCRAFAVRPTANWCKSPTCPHPCRNRRGQSLGHTGTVSTVVAA